MNMGEKIKSLREEKGMTLEELGNKIGVGKSTVRKWETGMIANMKRDKILKVAEALNTSPGYLMGWEKPSAQDDTAELLADIVGDRKLMKCISMIQNADEQDREKIYSYIEFVCSKK